MTATATVVFRLDATSAIGSGHAMRCIAIAQAIAELGGNSLFAVSNAESAEFLAAKGYEAAVLGGNPMELSSKDAASLSEFVTHTGAVALFVDTYAVDAAFFDGLQMLREQGVRVGYLDDLFTFRTGAQKVPVKWPVDLLLNYSLYADEAEYCSAYDGAKTKLLLGPNFAPLRREYRGLTIKSPREVVRDVLITTGATNPGGILERLSKLARDAFPEASIHVVVGAKSEFCAPCSSLDIMGPQSSLLPLMERCDVCISAAGTTIYELCAASVPSLCISAVDNQRSNAKAFASLDLGFGHDVHDADEVILHDLTVLNNVDVRRHFTENMRAVVVGDGAMKVARYLLGMSS